MEPLTYEVFKFYGSYSCDFIILKSSVKSESDEIVDINHI